MTPLDDLYPPSPTTISRDVTRPPPAYRLQVVVVLLSLFLFLVIYVVLTALAAYGVYWSFQQLANPTIIGGGRVGRGRSDPSLYFIGLGIACAVLFLFLFKSFFQSSQKNAALDVEVVETGQPKLFEFIRRLYAETGAPLPHRVYVNHEVNACVFFHQSFWSLFYPTKKNLLIGLGLVNRLNLSEFKAVLAHEFGHFSQNSMRLGGYVYTANMTIGKLVYGRDWLDDLIDGATRTDVRIALFAWTIKAVLWVLRKSLELLFKVINFAHSSMQRKMEFNADLMAYTMTGSDAIVHALAKLDFAGEALLVAGNDLFHAGAHGLFTRDLFYHQTKSVDFLRKRYKDPQKGEPPPLPEDPNAPGQVFQPGDLGIPLMWATHPSNFDREKNVKEHYVRSTIDDRPSWLVFENAEELRAAVTQRYYEIVQQNPEPKMVDAAKVQAFIDTEHHETTFDEKYHGMYDAGVISPGDLATLRTTVESEFASADHLATAHASLFHDDTRACYQEFVERQKDFNVLFGVANGFTKTATFKFRNEEHPAKKAKPLMEQVSKELEADQKWLEGHDARVFKTHYAMAQQVGGELLAEFQARYEFHLAIQNLVVTLQNTHNQIQQTLNSIAGQRTLEQADFQSVVTFLAESRQFLRDQLENADTWTIPPLKNMDDVTRLGRFLCAKPLPRELSTTEQSLDGQWIQNLLAAMIEVLDKGRRIQSKSMGGILILQDTITLRWRQIRDCVIPLPPSDGP